MIQAHQGERIKGDRRVMEKAFRHYLITRYNVPLTGWETDKRGIVTRDAAWLTHRYELFRTYCVPSVLAQHNTHFEWLIYLDEQTPQPFLSDIENLVSGTNHIAVRYTSGYFECLADINLSLQQAGTPYVITSRVDNDDALGLDFIDTIQSHFQPQHGLLLNVLHGHGYDTLRRVAMRLRNIPQNAFMSLIEKCNPEGNHISIRGFQHDNPPSHFTIKNIKADHGWLKIFHDRNLKSEPFGMPVWTNAFAKQYGLDPSVLPISLQATFHYLGWWLRDGIQRKMGFDTRS